MGTATKHVESLASSLPAPGVVVRPARPDEDAAGLVFDAAPQAYSAVAGSEWRARAAIEELWRLPGHSASFEHAIVAELDGRLAGVLIGFPSRDRYRLHIRLLRKSFRHVAPRRRPLLIAALPQLIAATPRPPRRAYYVGTIAIARHARRLNVASTLGYHAELVAQQRGFPVIVAHTGSRHGVARRALERYGMTPTKDRSWGYVLYVKSVDIEAVLAVDRVTKEIALRNRGVVRVVLTERPLFSRGISLKAEVALWVAAVACAVGALLLAPAMQHNVSIAAGVAAALAGAFGNLADRIVHGAVVDFVYLGRWPAFNLADVAIIGGVAVVGASLI